MTTMEPVILKEIRDSAIRIAIRLALGEYLLRGPQNNVLEPESRVAWATVVAELQNEGYIMVPPEEYAAVYGVAAADVIGMIEQEGSLFAIIYEAAGETLAVVPLAEREEREQLGPVPE
jgi:hypothetical protein